MFGVFNNNELVGIVVLNEVQPSEYSAIKWEHEDNRPLVMHRLCVHPNFQQQRIAGRLLKLSEQFATDNTYRSIRLDAFCRNPFALHLYEKSGYARRGTVTFRKGEFYCYEKMLVQQHL